MDWSMTDWLKNPVTYLLAIAVGTLVINALFWLRDVHLLKQSWNAFRAKVEKDIGELRDGINTLLARSQGPVSSQSPVRLTDLGEKMATFLQASEWAANTAPAVVHEVVNKKPFQIETFSREYVATNLDPDIEERVAACAYEFGTERDSVKSVLWVVLRDELLQRVEKPHP